MSSREDAGCVSGRVRDGMGVGGSDGWVGGAERSGLSRVIFFDFSNFFVGGWACWGKRMGTVWFGW